MRVYLYIFVMFFFEYLYREHSGTGFYEFTCLRTSFRPCRRRGHHDTRYERWDFVLSNPAELPVAGIGFRWLGLQMGLFSDSSLIETAQEGLRDADEIILALRDNPINYGFSPLSFSLFTSNLGVSVFAELSVDLELDDFADNGLPGIDYDVGGVGGGVGSLALSLTRWFSIGASLKYLYVAREKGTIPLLDPSAWENISEASYWIGLLTLSPALGIDAGGLLSFRSRSFDLDIAFTARDIGSTTSENEALSLKQTFNAGVGVELHGTTNTMHISCDYNDIENVNQQPLFKQLYCGTRYFFGIDWVLRAATFKVVQVTGLSLNCRLLILVSHTTRKNEESKWDKTRGKYTQLT